MKIDLSHVLPFLDKNQKTNLESNVSKVYETIFNKTGAGTEVGAADADDDKDIRLLAQVGSGLLDIGQQAFVDFGR